MGIIIISPWGRRIRLTEVDLSGTVEDLKRKIHEVRCIEPWQQQLFYKGQEMIYGRNLLADYNIQEDSEVILKLTVAPLKEKINKYKDLRVLAEMHNVDKMICRKCYCQLPSTATRCRQAKCGRTTNIRPKKTFYKTNRHYWPPKIFNKNHKWG